MAYPIRAVVYKKTVENITVDGGTALTGSGQLAAGRFNVRAGLTFLKLVPTGVRFVDNGADSRAFVLFNGNNSLELSGRWKTPAEAAETGSDGLVTESVEIEELTLFGQTYTRDAETVVTAAPGR